MSRSEHYLTKYVDIDPALLTFMGDDEGEPKLKIDLYYYREGKRGLKLCITRMLCGDTFEKCSLMDDRNAYAHLLPMQRKNDKTGRKAAGVIETHIDEIVTVATASDQPDFQGLIDRLAPKVREAVA